MSSEILRAPPLRVTLVKLALVIASIALLLALTRALLFPWLRAWLVASADAAEALRRFRLVAIAVALPIFAGGIWLVRLAARVSREARWQLAGAFVWRDTPVVRGRGARRRALVLLVLGLLLVADAVAFAMLPGLFANAGSDSFSTQGSR